MNPMNLLKIKGLLEQVKGRHPRVCLFLADAGKTMNEGTVMELTITTPEGRSLCTNMKVTAEDMELIRQIKEIAGSQR